MTAAFRSNFLRSITRERNRLWGVLHLPSQGPWGVVHRVHRVHFNGDELTSLSTEKKRKGDSVLRESQTERQELGKVVERVTVNIK